MMMLPEAANIVVKASNYNPSIVSKDWLHRKGIFTETAGRFLHTPVFSLVEGEHISIVVDEQRLQILAKAVTKENLTRVGVVGAKFVAALPETPYTAVGLNFQYSVPSEKCRMQNVLSPNKARLAKLFSKTYEVGATVVFSFRGFIATLKVAPPHAGHAETQIDFNFHSDANGVEKVLKMLSLREQALEKAGTIVQGLCQDE